MYKYDITIILKFMGLLQKPVALFVIIALSAGVYFMLVMDGSVYGTYHAHMIDVNISNKHGRSVFQKVERFIGITYRKDSHAVKGYITDEIRFDNVKAIQKVINAELNELDKLGIKRERSDNVFQRKKPIVKTKEAESNGKKTIKPQSNSGGNEIATKGEKIKGDYGKMDNNVRIKYRFRNPRKKDLEKLSKEQLDIEEITDPLPTSAKCPALTFLTVFVVSMPRNFLRRQHIRDSWGYSYLDGVKLIKHSKSIKERIPLKDMFRVVFVVGMSKKGMHMDDIHKEARLSKDIVFGSFIEDYRNLTMKTKLGFKWSFFECNSLYTLKTDDDVFMNPVMLVEWLKDLPRSNLYTGWCNFNSPVVRDKRDKWYVSVEDFAPASYPGYCLGGGYLMSNDVVGKVMALSYGRKLFPMEDLYIGLMIDEMKEVKVRDERGHFDLVFGGRSNDCDLNGLFLAHSIYGSKMMDLFKRAQGAIGKC